MVDHMLKMADRQGLLKGDLNYIQRFGLSRVMNREQADLIELETIRTENMALASNPATSSEFLKALFEDRKVTEVFDTSEWQSPEAAEDIQDFLQRAFG
jgi:hypothetical protein